MARVYLCVAALAAGSRPALIDPAALPNPRASHLRHIMCLHLNVSLNVIQLRYQRENCQKIGKKTLCESGAAAWALGAGGRWFAGERLVAIPDSRIVSAVVQLSFPRDCEMSNAKTQIQIA
ncbi:unnamed protein product [Arctia plantaginis]|uniref:Uncharacterized protein n=1 Tax=Arctia plantaginis TaxID=874455 RepID=A0A8S0YWY2_ARCPL|nr:unnamed protein product [Arctia plantaginis]